MSRKRREDGVKKSILFDPGNSGKFIPTNREAVKRKFFEQIGWSLDLFLITFFVLRQKAIRDWGKVQIV
jgi:hypothetical protein